MDHLDLLGTEGTEAMPVEAEEEVPAEEEVTYTPIVPLNVKSISTMLLKEEEHLTEAVGENLEEHFQTTTGIETVKANHPTHGTSWRYLMERQEPLALKKHSCVLSTALWTLHFTQLITALTVTV